MIEWRTPTAILKELRMMQREAQDEVDKKRADLFEEERQLETKTAVEPTFTLR